MNLRKESICGPRCVQLILEKMGTHISLETLVLEMQGGHVDAGATIGDVCRALAKRNVHYRVVYLPPNASLNWPEPAIVLLRAKSVDTQPGHFLVSMGVRSDGDVSLCDPMEGAFVGNAELLNELIESSIVLVSTKEISNEAVYAQYRDTSQGHLIWLFVLLVVLSYVYRKSVFLRRRRQND